ncbi:uncharacterized protein LOC130509987 [Raphanus sativus]|uniref:Uncharacterized protein LOC130509987 n=1 Tax=Raphanus sativus TaxID=3726 RepID=A0A9W3DEN7_RAPSA|nr:uncharacterized protein LOC130509987 [Raphanus sativus]
MEGSISPLCVRSSSTLCYFSNNVSLNSHRSLGFIFVILSGDELCIPANGNRRLFLSPTRGALRTPTLTAEEVKDVPMPKIDKSCRLSSPRAARELALIGTV